MVISKYVKLGITIVIAILIVDLIVFNVFLSSNGNQYNEMRRIHDKNSQMLKAQNKIRLEEQTALQSKRNYQTVNKAMWQAPSYSSNNSNNDNWRRNAALRKQKDEDRVIAKEKSRIARVKKSEQQRKQSENLRSIRAKNDDTCAFWRDAYRKSPVSTNQQHRNSACARAAND